MIPNCLREKTHIKKVVRILTNNGLQLSLDSFDGVSYSKQRNLTEIEITVKFLFRVLEAINMASMILMGASAYFPEYLRARLSAGLLFALKRKQPRIDALATEGLHTPISGAIEAREMRFAYPNCPARQVLRGLSMTLPAGRTLALVGTSGCGKSTVVQLLERFYDVVGSGVLTIDGVDIRHYNVGHLRSAMALVGQEPTLFNLSIHENIAYGMLRRGEDTNQGADILKRKVEEAAKLANIHAFIESLPQVGKKIHSYHNGFLIGNRILQVGRTKSVLTKVVQLIESNEPITYPFDFVGLQGFRVHTGTPRTVWGI